MKKKEIWLPVKGYKGYYEVSNRGQVRGVDRRVKHRSGKMFLKSAILIPIANQKGYLRIALLKKSKRFTAAIHRLVAIAFILNPQNKPQVNHKNGIKSDNRVVNLEWCTQTENMIHRVVTGLTIMPKGEEHAHILKEKDVINIRKLHSKGMTYKEIHLKYPQVTSDHIGCVVRRRTWTHI